MNRRILFGFILLVLGLLTAEIFARAYYYRKPASNSLAIVELFKAVNRRIFNTTPKKKINNEAHYFFRPNFSKAQNDSVVAEMTAANYSIYQPWVEFKFGNFRGKYINAFDQIRKSSPEVSAFAEKPITIWFIGGSTTFGFNVIDAETIPSAFVREYQKRGYDKPIKVVNYGMPLYYSYHELMLIADNLFRGHHPDIVIMLDGLNDCAAPYAALLKYPYNAPRMQQLLNPELYHYPRNFTFSEFPDSSKIESDSRMIFSNYLENIANIKKLADAHEFKLHCFWQPVPYYEYDRKSDPYCAKRTKPQYEIIYPVAELESREIDYLYYLGDMLKSEKNCFIDSVHYSPRINELIAKRMIDSIFLK